jgi:hypothetical protein
MIMVAFVKAVILNSAIYAVWYYLEYKQFGILQWDRKCDDVVSVIYFLLTWYLFAKK